MTTRKVSRPCLLWSSWVSSDAQVFVVVVGIILVSGGVVVVVVIVVIVVVVIVVVLVVVVIVSGFLVPGVVHAHSNDDARRS